MTRRCGIVVPAFLGLLFLSLWPLFAQGSGEGPEAQSCLTQSPRFSHQAGFYKEPIRLSLEAAADARILYTLDGSDPVLHDNEREWLYATLDHRKEREPDIDLRSSRTTSFEYETPFMVREGSGASAYGGIAVSRKQVISQDAFIRAVVVRARAIRPGCRPSSLVTNTYFIGVGADRIQLPIVSLTVNPPGLFSYSSGIYVPWREERMSAPGFAGAFSSQEPALVPGSVEVFYGARRVMSREAAVSVVRDGSNDLPMESLQLEFTSAPPEAEGDDGLRGLPPAARELLASGQVLLRNGGMPDYFGLMYRSRLVADLTRNMRLDNPLYYPAVHFINGEFWGMVNLRQVIGDGMAAGHREASSAVDVIDYQYLARQLYERGVFARFPGKSVDQIAHAIFGGELNVDLGNAVNDYVDMVRFAVSHDLADDGNMQRLRRRMDIYNYARYAAVQVYTGNQDWPENAVTIWRRRHSGAGGEGNGSSDGLWRWQILDSDAALLGQDTTGRGLPLADNFLADVAGTEGPSPAWSSGLFRSLLKNTEFRHHFINTLCDLANLSFREDQVRRFTDRADTQLAGMRDLQRGRWPDSLQENSAERVLGFAARQQDRIFEDIRTVFDTRGESRIIVVLPEQQAGRGHVRVNSLDIEAGVASTRIVHDEVEQATIWGGRYFRGIPVWIEAVPAPGYRFAGWQEEPINRRLLVFSPSEEFHRFTPMFEPIESGLDP